MTSSLSIGCLLRGIGNRRVATASLLALPRRLTTMQVRNGGNASEFIKVEDHMRIRPTRWNFVKAMDYLHFYFVLLGTPLLLAATYCNIFIGPAKLEPIPEGYRPKEWEYYRHPIQRFFMKYIYPSEQEVYERLLHKIWQDDKERRQKMLLREVNRLMKEDGDSSVYYTVPSQAKTLRVQDNVEVENRLLRGRWN